MNTLFIRGPAITLRFLLLVIVSAAILVADHRYRALEVPRGWLLTLMQPVQIIADWPTQRWHQWTAVVSSHVHLMQQNQHLRETNQRLVLEHQQFASLQAENQRLHALLGSVATASQPARYQLARIYQVSLDPHSQQVQIDRGSDDQVYLGQPVISSAGVFGQVVHLGPTSAQVLQITDEDHAIPVINRRSGERAIVRGEGPSGLLKLPFLPAHADIQQGDLLLTSGLGKTFPKGYPVATVRSVSVTAGNNFASVVAVPVAEPDKVQEVLLLWPDRGSLPVEPAEMDPDLQREDDSRDE
ncbi:MAG: rod shape-determining protein MreC [Gammaproteobacteria bacterium]